MMKSYISSNGTTPPPVSLAERPSRSYDRLLTYVIDIWQNSDILETMGIQRPALVDVLAQLEESALR
jgi:hypothetical protein